MKNAYERSKRFGRIIMAESLNLHSDFREFIESLNSHDVKYLIVGGYAVGVHGRPRYTKDLDVWLERSPENAAKVTVALNHFGFGSIGLKQQDFLTPNQIIQLGRPPNRIDLLTSVTGVAFDDCFPKRVVVSADGIPVNFIGLEDLRKNKQASGRMQDLADLENLQ